MSERRKIDRLSPLVVRTEFPGKQGGQKHGYLTNLSEKGAFLATDEDLQSGDRLDLRFVLPWGLGEHEALATVMWCTSDVEHDSSEIPTGVGLSFSEIADPVRDGIRRYQQKFFEILARIEKQGVNSVLATLAQEGSTGTETVH
jgi:hypothetical protein